MFKDGGLTPRHPLQDTPPPPPSLPPKTLSPVGRLIDRLSPSKRLLFSEKNLKITQGFISMSHQYLPESDGISLKPQNRYLKKQESSIS